MRKRNSASGKSTSRPITRWSPDHTLLAIIACITFVVAIAIRIRLLGIPLERDEGEYAYTGQLMLEGIPPYKLAYSMKFPGTAAAYAVIMSLFGQSITAIHLGLLLVNVATGVLIFLLGRRLLNSAAGYAAAASYALLSLSPSMFGLASHATHLVVLPVLAGILLLLNVSSRGGFLWVFVSGLFFGLGLLMKQPAIFFIVFGGGYLLLRDIRNRLGPKTIFLRNLTFAAGVSVPFAITCLLLWSAGVFNRFWFWTIDYARQYGSEMSFSEATKDFIPNLKGVIGPTWPLWALAALGLLIGLWRRRTRGAAFFLWGLLVFSVLALASGLYLRNHYFILILPALSLSVAALVSGLVDLGSPALVRSGLVVLLGGALGWPIYQTRNIFFQMSPAAACRKIYGANPFVEAIIVAQYLRDRTSPSEQIAVLGSEPEIYFYAHRHSATGYIYTYGLVEGQPYALQMQREMVHEVELARPKYFVVIGVSYSWLSKPGSRHPVFDWITDYTRQNYDLVGFVNMLGPDRTDYYFDDLPKSLPTIGNRIFVDRKKL